MSRKTCGLGSAGPERSGRSLASPVLIAVALVLGSVPALGADPLEKEIRLNLPPDTFLGDALIVWGMESGMQVMVATDSVARQRTEGVQGVLSAGAALAALLQNTGLEYSAKGNTVAVAPRKYAEQKVSGEGNAGARNRVQIESASGGNGGSSAPLEEVLVTAQRREERLKDVPLSITVLGGSDLDRSPIAGIAEALNTVPGVTATVGAQAGGTAVAVRGVGAAGPLFFGSSPVGYYLDSVPLGLVKTAVMPDSNAYDLARVEVLRGPQGTLYGAGGENGVVRVLTHDADLNRFELKARTSTSTTQDSGESYRGDLAVNVPVVPGKLGARMVVGYENLSGWIDKPNDRDANDGERRSARLKINAEPVENFHIGASAWMTRDHYGMGSASDDNERRSSLIDEPQKSNFEAYGVQLGYDFPQFSISSMTSYLDYETGGTLDLAPLGLAAPLFTGLWSKVFSQELVLHSTETQSWRWSAGAFYRDARDRLLATLSVLPAPQDFGDTSESTAVFGELTRLLLGGKWEITGGLRYFEDDVAQFENVRFNGVTTEPLYHVSNTFHAVSPRVVLTWHPSDAWTLYSSYSEGFRSGFAQNSNVAAAAPEFSPVKPDELTNYEIGAKGELAGGRISIDSAVYYIDWRDVQQILLVPLPGGGGAGITAGVNGESASGPGVDLAVTTHPIENLQLGISLSWNDLTLDGNVAPGGVLLFSKGDRLNYSSEYTAGVMANYTFPMGSSGFNGRFSLTANYLSKQMTRTLFAGGRAVAVGDDIFIARMSLAVSSPEHWTASLFADNLTDENGRMPASDPSGPLEWSPHARPRTVGVQIEYKF